MNTDHMFIRGTNYSVLVERSTQDDLYNNITTEWPTTKKRHNATSDVSIKTISLLPYIGMKMLHVTSEVTSISGERYNISIQFLNVQFSQSESADVVQFVGKDGQEYFVYPIALTQSDTKVKCNCLDFRWRFATWNKRDNSLIGKAPPPYIKKTDRPPVNPNQVPGVCKHILKVVDKLKSLGIVK